ncbi:MAG TPA: rRNA pseudouridine synthase [Arenimonas sp.]|uniref:rRNA pseudouridine synthase n=1 Tax=Arenimonas sp. TaxID=1872635 RepID=UPI002C3F1E34|nr:rRNA pseudouridine synthase [Arenimonas sp.]HMB56891.1 rRNA pseudouridine synthase [Arenimonas sp.]
MTEPVRLAKRVAELIGCSRAEAEQYIEDGWVSVDGVVIEETQFQIHDQKVEIDAQATLEASEPATILLHKPAGVEFSTSMGSGSSTSMGGDSGISRRLDSRASMGVDPRTSKDSAIQLLTARNWSADFQFGRRFLRRHLKHLSPLFPLDTAASGLVVFSQDPRLLRRLREDGDRIEEELIVEVSGEIAPYGLPRLCHGLSFNGRNLPPIKVSWQNENRLRFALKSPQPGQIRHMCAEVGLEVMAIKRIRLGRVPLAKLPVGEWRYLPLHDKF